MLPAYYCLVASALIIIAQSTHVDWDTYHRWNYSQDDGRDKQQEDQFQGYPTNYPPQTTISPVITSTGTADSGRRSLLKSIFQQVLGPNFTSPGLTDLAFLSDRPSLPLRSQIWDNQQDRYETPPQGPYVAQSQVSALQYELPDYILPPPPPAFDYNYYYQ